MPWTVSILADYPIVETVYTGVVHPSELSQAIMETINIVLAHGFKMRLADCSAIDAGPRIGSLCLLGDELSRVQGARGIKQAVILPNNSKVAADVLFWEAVCANRAIPVRVFKDRQSALDWLLARPK